MNIYRFLLFTLFFKNLFCFNIQRQNIVFKKKQHISLYMKKKQQSISNLYIPKTEKQNTYVKYLNDNNNKLIVSLGPAGTGKTLFACQKAITQLKTEEINKIIITRPVVTVEEEIGFLPGNIVKKMDPWTKPIFDIFLEYFSKAELDLMLFNNKIEICPLAFMRGRTFKNAFIIADEMQNSSPNQMKMLTTRLGDNSRIVITGDLKQTDIKTENGLNDFIMRYKKYHSENNSTKLINIVEFENVDIERSEIVKKVIEIYDYKGSNIPYIKKVENNVTTIPNISQNITRNTTRNNTNQMKYIEYDDAALIPKHHRSHNYDIFFESRDF